MRVKAARLEEKRRLTIAFTYALPFNVLAFDVKPFMRVEVKAKSNSAISPVSFQGGSDGGGGSGGERTSRTSWSFGSEGATIGRSIQNSINFLDEQSISATHAVIFYSKRGGFFI